LNYKIWSTKESQFNAHKRLLQKSKRSHLCQRILLLYFIAITFFSLYNVLFDRLYPENVVVLSVISLSLFLVVFSQFENKKSYPEKAREFYNYGVELASLYNVLLIFKSLIENQTVESKHEFAEKIALSYQSVMELQQNHDPIDLDVFKSKTAQYHNLNWFDIQKIRFKYYRKTCLMYHVLIVLPPLLLLILL